MAGGERGRQRRFLVAGCGSIGKRHIRNLVALEAGGIVACDPRADRRREVEAEFGITTVASLDELLAQPADAVLVTAPTSLHLSLALKAAEHGCALFIEKPLSDRMEGVERLLEVVTRKQLVTLVGCNMRFHPGVARVKRLLEEGAAGRIVAARVEVGQYLPDWHPWEDYREMYSARRDLGGGVILDAIHELDYIRWMLGEVESVACFAGKLSHLEIETEDTAGILLRFASGAIGEVHLDYVQRAYSRSCQVIGDEGTIWWDWSAGEVRHYSAGLGRWRVFPKPERWEPNQMYVEELRHFLRCLDGEGEPLQDVREAAAVLGVALAAKAAAETGKVVRLGRG